MLDIRYIRENQSLMEHTCKIKNINFDIAELIAADDERKSLQTKFDDLKRQINEGNQKIRSLSAEEKPAHLAQMKEISSRSKEIEELQRQNQELFHKMMMQIPSPVADGVPVGKDDSENVRVKTWGDIPQFAFEAKSHVELGNTLGMLDIERGVKISGSRFYFLKNMGTLLEIALMRYALDFLMKRGFTIMTVPLLVKDLAMSGTGYFPGGEEQAYKMAKDDLFLIGTSEVPLASYHYDEVLKMEQFPVRYASWSHCFRREAGTYGKDTQGLYRIHQFQKVEQVIVIENDERKSLEAHEFLLKNAEDFLQSLEIPYEVTLVCSGDMGQGQVKKYDINSWMPSRNGYGETHSCSMFYEFQARRLNLRYRDAEGKMKFCHTLNNTLVASPRILIPLMEIHQTESGSIKIPAALQPYMGGLKEIQAS